jgi:hypothetical protein
MWAITSYFNPCKYKTRLRNYRRFREALRLPLVTVELCFDDEFELSDGDADILVRIPNGAMIWQKERLLNVALEHVPSHAETVAWFDCDVLFGKNDWAEAAVELLGRYKVVQLFSEHHDLPPYCMEIPDSFGEPSGRAIAALIANDGDRSSDFLSPTTYRMRSASLGMAWAARRTTLQTHGFYDGMIVGGGDRSIACAMYGRFDDAVSSLELNRPRTLHYLNWAIPFYAEIQASVGHLPGKLFHLWHGDLQHRGYRERHRRFAEFPFDPQADLKIGATGAWEWKTDCPGPKKFLTQYFATRFEDGAAEVPA